MDPIQLVEHGHDHRLGQPQRIAVLVVGHLVLPLRRHGRRPALRHRERIAKRLVAESATRQVIVFTHDLVFLNDMIAYLEKELKYYSEYEFESFLHNIVSQNIPISYKNKNFNNQPKSG